MKSVKDFEIFLENWCIKNKKPNPGIDKVNTIWKTAWDEFVSTELVKEYEERKEEYLNMKSLSVNELKKREIKEEIISSSNGWDEVKKLLKD